MAIVEFMLVHEQNYSRIIISVECITYCQQLTRRSATIDALQTWKENSIKIIL
jgi:hypothetical protein